VESANSGAGHTEGNGSEWISPDYNVRSLGKCRRWERGSARGSFGKLRISAGGSRRQDASSSVLKRLSVTPRSGRRVAGEGACATNDRTSEAPPPRGTLTANW